MAHENILRFPKISAFTCILTHGTLKDLSGKDSAALLFAECDATLLVGMRVYTLAAGDALLVPPSTFVSPTERGKEFSGYRLLFPYDILSLFAPRMFFRAADGGDMFAFPPACIPRLFDRLSILAEARENTATALPSLFSLLENEALPESGVPLPLPKLLRRSLKYLNEHVNEDVTTAVLSERYGVSESTILRAFREYLSLTPLAYLKGLRSLREDEK